MTSPISASISIAASQVNQQVQQPHAANGLSQGEVSGHVLAQISTVAAERSSSVSVSDEKRTIKREQARSEGSFASQKEVPDSEAENKEGGNTKTLNVVA